MEKIFKLQRSLFSSTGEDRVLIYDQHKQQHLEMLTTKELAARFGERAKFYALGILAEDKFTCLDEVPAQSW